MELSKEYFKKFSIIMVVMITIIIFSGCTNFGSGKGFLEFNGKMYPLDGCGVQKRVNENKVDTDYFFYLRGYNYNYDAEDVFFRIVVKNSSENKFIGTYSEFQEGVFLFRRNNDNSTTEFIISRVKMEVCKSGNDYEIKLTGIAQSADEEAFDEVEDVKTEEASKYDFKLTYKGKIKVGNIEK